jgi:hypothetical protein
VGSPFETSISVAFSISRTNAQLLRYKRAYERVRIITHETNLYYNFQIISNSIIIITNVEVNVVPVHHHQQPKPNMNLQNLGRKNTTLVEEYHQPHSLKLSLLGSVRLRGIKCIHNHDATNKKRLKVWTRTNNDSFSTWNLNDFTLNFNREHLRSFVKGEERMERTYVCQVFASKN